jgi:hypothetical protein
VQKSELCYIDALSLEGPLADFDHVDVRDRTDWKIGRLDGVIIDPAERRLRYLVVDNDRLAPHRYLVPLDATQLDVEHRALYVHADLTSCEEFDERRFRTFSTKS